MDISGFQLSASMAGWDRLTGAERAYGGPSSPAPPFAATRWHDVDPGRILGYPADGTGPCVRGGVRARLAGASFVTMDREGRSNESPAIHPLRSHRRDACVVRGAEPGGGAARGPAGGRPHPPISFPDARRSGTLPRQRLHDPARRGPSGAPGGGQPVGSGRVDAGARGAARHRALPRARHPPGDDHPRHPRPRRRVAHPARDPRHRAGADRGAEPGAQPAAGAGRLL